MKTHLHVLRFALVSAGLLLALQACGGAPPVTPPVSAVIGAAGGTLSTSSGATVVIPPGALSGNVTIGIEQSSVGAPPLPGGFTTVGQMFAFTPHGQNFAAPVTITLPFNPASVPAGSTPQLYKDNAQKQWEPVVGATFGSSSVSGSVTSFSFPVVVIPPVESVGSLSRVFVFSQLPRNGPQIITDGRLTGSQEKATAGPLEVFASVDGKTYWAATGPKLGSANSFPTGGNGLADVTVTQSFVKRAPNAKARLVLSAINIEAADFNPNFSTSESAYSGCSKLAADMPKVTKAATCGLLHAHVQFTATAFVGGLGPGQIGRNTFLDMNGQATLEGFLSNWSFRLAEHGRTPLWAIGRPVGEGLETLTPKVTLPKDIVIEIDLSSVEVCPPEREVKDCQDRVFTISSSVLAFANNLRGRESDITAMIRDPLSVSGGALTVTGLESTDTPASASPVGVEEPVPCASPNPAAGVLQFSSPGYDVPEGAFRTSDVLVTRTGGSQGAVSVTFRASDGTAVTNVDYSAPAVTVHFGDGDTTTRSVELTALSDAETEPDKTVNLLLSEPGGCATLGAQSSAVVTLLDDDEPPPPTFTVGGTVTGLTGTGLVLEDRANGLDLTPTGNGPFTFPLSFTAPRPYDVRVKTQPLNPLQTCSVTNGTGTISNANITNIAVDCVTPVVNGALDPGFGDAGKTFTPFGGDETALALQADGKVVMVGGSPADFTLARYTTAGRLDSSFGIAGTGMVTTDIATENDQARGVAIQQLDGKIVVVGSAVVGRTASNASNSDFAVARYNIDGTPDTSFSGDGKVTTDFNLLGDSANAVAIQSDGKIVVVGSTTLTNPGFADFAIARYDTNGTLDSSFDGDGKLTTAVGARVDFARNVVILANQTILVSGFSEVNSRDGTGLVQYTSNGVLDTSFGGGTGKTSVPNHRLEEGLSVQSNGQILIAGSVNVGVFPTGSSHFGVMRFSATGVPDNGFGTAGLVTLAFTTLNDFGRAIALQADGKIVVVGQSSNFSNPDFGIARFNADGTPDGSFGTGGKLTVSFFNSFDGAESVVIQPDGKIVVGGFATSGTRSSYALARVNP